ITELVDPFSSMEKRVKLHKVLNSILTNPNLEIVPPSRELFEAGLDLHCRRDDKSWSLTDCISFIVMERYELTDALTRDHHLRQAGFNTLLN
ncbi:type II toxin-antitoxin system VapC family toxin, partial [Candidatus Sumerlaeota bacterium]|nr:type II toxin-antitoxin system VapC family toxin [Candidatus Sumerlaeota bacterium]